MKDTPKFNELSALLCQRDNVYRLCPDNWSKVPQNGNYIALTPELYDYLSKEKEIKFLEEEKKQMYKLAKEVFYRKAPTFGEDSYSALVKEYSLRPGKKDRAKIKEEAIAKTKEYIKIEIEKWYKSFLIRKYLLDKLVLENQRLDLTDQNGNKLEEILKQY